MRAQLPTENLTIHHKVDDYPTWRKGDDESEKSRVATSIAVGKAFRDAEDLMERMIREHAYQLWDRSGRPEGRSDPRHLRLRRIALRSRPHSGRQRRHGYRQRSRLRG